MKKLLNVLGTLFMIGLVAAILVALIAIPVYAWKTGDTDLTAIKHQWAVFVSSRLPAQDVSTGPSCTRWSWLNGEHVYTMKEKILSVDAVTDYEILMTVEACGQIGPGRLHFQTRWQRDAILPSTLKGGYFEITRLGKNDTVISVVTAR